MSDIKRRGRKPKFVGPQRELLADLIRQHGIRGTKTISTIPICESTLGEIAREHGIKLKPGRRRKAA